MAFTDNCDLYAAIHEDGVNRVIGHIMRQRPSMFNYGTFAVASNNKMWCLFVEHTGDVPKYFNPFFTVLPDLPVLGADSPPVTLDFCVQLEKAKMDFHPGNVISLPAQLAPPLANQRFALQFRACGAIGCPAQAELDALPIVLPVPGAVQPPSEALVPLPSRPEALDPVHVRGLMKCFCLDVFVVGHFERAFVAGYDSLQGRVDGIEIVDIQPDSLEDNIECYVRTGVSLTLRQKLTIPLQKFFVAFPLFGMAAVILAPTGNPLVPNNPAVEEHQLKAFVTMKVI